MVQELTTSRSGLLDGYVRESSSATNLGSSSGQTLNHRPSLAASFTTTTPSPVSTTFSGSEDQSNSSGEQINEAALQESFDKLSRQGSRYKTKIQHKQANANPSMTYDLVKTGVSRINYLDLGHDDINSNKLDATNGTLDGDLHGDELDENFTLVDLQRSRVSLDGGKSFRGKGSNAGKSFNDNILGTIGKI